MTTKDTTPDATGPRAGTTAPERPGPARRYVIPILAGLALGLVYGWVVAWRGTGAFWPTLIVQAAVSTPILAVAVRLFVTDRARLTADTERHAFDVERHWATQAAATSFAVLIGGLVLADTLGEILRIGWLSPVTIDHVLVLGLGTFVVSYLHQRRAAR